MLSRLPFNIAVNTMLVLLSLVIVFHLMVLAQVIPYTIVWGGNLKSVSEMRLFETISILINILLMSVIAVSGKRVNLNLPRIVPNIILGLFVVLFALNTIGNLFAKATVETIAFTPVTLVSAILCYRIATEK